MAGMSGGVVPMKREAYTTGWVERVHDRGDGFGGILQVRVDDDDQLAAGRRDPVRIDAP